MSLTIETLTQFAFEELTEAAQHAKSITSPDCREVIANIDTHVEAAQKALSLLRSFGSKRMRDIE